MTTQETAPAASETTAATTEGTAAAATTTDTAATAASATTDKAQTTDGKPAEKDDSLLFKEKKPDTEKAEDKKAEEDKKEGDDKKPDEKTAFDIAKITTPEDLPIPDAMKDKVTALVSELNNPELTTQEKVQKMVDLHVEIQNQSRDGWEKIKEDWRKECVDDKEIGGAALDGVVGSVNDVVRQFASNPEYGGSPELFEELKADLTVLGLGNKKSFIKFMNNVAKATRGDEAGGGDPSAANAKLPREQILYPGMK